MERKYLNNNGKMQVERMQNEKRKMENLPAGRQVKNVYTICVTFQQHST